MWFLLLTSIDVLVNKSLHVAECSGRGLAMRFGLC